MGIQFAPLKVPLQRRLETCAACAWICVMAFGSITSILMTIYLLIFTKWIKFVVILYISWIYFIDKDTCNRGGRRNRWALWMRHSVWWKYFCAYFPIRLVKTVDLDPSRNYLLCSYPHGVLASGALAAFGTDALGFTKLFPGLEPKMLTLTQHFMVPFFREFAYSFGSSSTNAKNIETLLKYQKTSDPEDLNKAVVLVVGGAAESLNSKPSTYHIILSKRKGFVKIALKTGTPLVPVFSFGETDIYNQITGLKDSLLTRIQQGFKRITGISPVLVLGRGLFQYSFGLLPHRRPITVVVGEPLEIPTIADPSRDEINHYHALFKEKLIELFETQKDKYLPNAHEIHLVIY